MVDKIYKLLNLKYTMQAEDIKPASYKCTVVFVHGLGNSSRTWTKITKKISEENNKCRIIAVDLIGFGKSKKPDWIKYNLNYQALALDKTLRKLRVKGPIVIVGHSLGSLVSIEYSKLFPDKVSSLILCSPPIYKNEETTNKSVRKTADDFLKNLYMKAYSKPDSFLRVTKMAKKYKLLDDGFLVDETNIKSYMTTLSASIIHQSSFEDAKNINKPILIIRGRMDPLVIYKNLKELKELNNNISIKNIVGGHDIKGKYIETIASSIEKITKQ